MRSYIKFCLTFFFYLSITGTLLAQADLSFQGILKKSNGTAVEDGEYMMTFSLHTTESGGSAAWTSAQLNVTVTSGIYSVILNPTVTFNTIYYMGVKVGSSPELVPRFKLTSAPYALSLIGTTNKFPSSGIVKADTLIVANKMAIGATAVATNQSLKVNGGVFAKGGAPGAAGVSNAGYAFEGTSGDNDSGLFSTADGQVSLYNNNTARLTANSTGVEVTGDVRMSSGGAISYNGLKDWQLVDIDDFSTDTEGWNAYIIGNLFGNGALVPSAIERVTTPANDFVDNFVRPINTQLTHMIKKQYNLNSITHTQVRIEFSYLFLGSWDGTDWAVGGVASGPTDQMTCMWSRKNQADFSVDFRTILAGVYPLGDNMQTDEIIFNSQANTFHLGFSGPWGEGITNESWGITNVKVYVR